MEVVIPSPSIMAGKSVRFSQEGTSIIWICCPYSKAWRNAICSLLPFTLLR